MSSSSPIKLQKVILSMDRAYALSYSLQIESFINTILTKAFSLSKDTNICFGISSRSLSFNNKLALLFDLRSITSDDQKTLIKFSEIRNKFAHVLNCHNIKTALEITDSLIFFEKRYKLGLDYSSNENCYLLFERLIEEIETILTGLIDKIKLSEFDAGKTWASIKITEKLMAARDDSSFLDDIEGNTKDEIVYNFLHKIVDSIKDSDFIDLDNSQIVKKFKLL